MKFDKDGRIIQPKETEEDLESLEEWNRLREETKKLSNKNRKYEEASLKAGARKHGNSYTDNEIEEILHYDKNDFEQVLKLAIKFERKFTGIQWILEIKRRYLNGNFNEDFCLDSFGKQIKRIMEK